MSNKKLGGIPRRFMHTKKLARHTKSARECKEANLEHQETRMEHQEHFLKYHEAILESKEALVDSQEAFMQYVYEIQVRYSGMASLCSIDHLYNPRKRLGIA